MTSLLKFEMGEWGNIVSMILLLWMVLPWDGCKIMQIASGLRTNDFVGSERYEYASPRDSLSPHSLF